MKLKALQDFSYFYMGFTKEVKSNEVFEVEDKIGKDFIQQGLVEEVKEVKKSKKEEVI